MLYNFDLISDIHIDFWVKCNNVEELKEDLQDFISYIIPETPAKVLIIAGDLGHYNNQNYIFLTEIKKYYEHIILVAGNHDFYLVSNNAKKKYHNDSKNRQNEMVQMTSTIENVHYLDGDTIIIDGITYGGCTMWYDYSYGTKIFGQDLEMMHKIWKEKLNDNHYIHGLKFDSQLTEFYDSLKRLNQIIDKSNVIITHVSPDCTTIPFKYQMDITSSFYYFDGSEFFDKINDKVWCYGHTHDRYDYDKYSCRFVNASFGYPSETKSITRKIVNISC